MRTIFGQHAIFLGTVMLSLSLALAQEGAQAVPYYSGWKWYTARHTQRPPPTQLSHTHRTPLPWLHPTDFLLQLFRISPCAPPC